MYRRMAIRLIPLERETVALMPANGTLARVLYGIKPDGEQRQLSVQWKNVNRSIEGSKQRAAALAVWTMRSIEPVLRIAAATTFCISCRNQLCGLK